MKYNEIASIKLSYHKICYWVLMNKEKLVYLFLIRNAHFFQYNNKEIIIIKFVSNFLGK